MSVGLLALLDDVAAIAKVAAAHLDDVASQVAKAGAKAAGVVIDDTAVTPGYVIGFAAKRELPIVGRIAAGSLRNKLLILLPAALALSYFLHWTITPLLMIGGTYLCYEGVEKVLEAIMPHHAHRHEAQLGTVALNTKTLEDEKVASAIKTDFILSAEIMAIALDDLPRGSFVTQAVVLALVGIEFTVAVYGVVALIVESRRFRCGPRQQRPCLGPCRYGPGVRTRPCSRDAGVPDHSQRGRHSRHDLGWRRHYPAWPGRIRPAFNRRGGPCRRGGRAHALPSAAGALEWIVKAAISGVLGFLVGAATIPVVGFAVAPAWKGLKHLLPGSRK